MYHKKGGKQGGSVLTKFMWLRIRTNGGLM